MKRRMVTTLIGVFGFSLLNAIFGFPHDNAEVMLAGLIVAWWNDAR